MKHIFCPDIHASGYSGSAPSGKCHVSALWSFELRKKSHSGIRMLIEHIMVSFPEILRRSGAHSLVWRRLLCSGIPQCQVHYIRNKVCPCILMMFQWLMTRAPSLIGSTQLFVVFSLGLIGGRMFDTGYWFVHMSSRLIGKTELIAIIARSAALPCSCCASSCFRCRIRSSSTSSVAGREYLFSHILNHCLTQVFLRRVGLAMAQHMSPVTASSHSISAVSAHSRWESGPQ